MEYKTINDVKFKMLFVDRHEEYFYKLALDTLIKEDKLELENLEGDFLKHLYGFILQMIYVDFCDIIHNGGFEYDFNDIDEPLSECNISIFHKYYLNENKDEENAFFDTFSSEEFSADEVVPNDEYYQRIENLDKYDMLQELIAYFRPIVTGILCEKFSTIKLLYLMYYANQQKNVLNKYGEDYEDYESIEDYLSYVEECIKEQPLTNVEAYSWIDEEMPQRS